VERTGNYLLSKTTGFDRGTIRRTEIDETQQALPPLVIRIVCGHILIDVVLGIGVTHLHQRVGVRDGELGDCAGNDVHWCWFFVVALLGKGTEKPRVLW